MATSRFPTATVAPDELRSSRAQVLAAATRRLGREPLAVFAQGLNPSRFDSWMPGLRRKAYRFFPASTELVKEVLLLAVNPDRAQATDELVEALSTAASEADGPAEAARALSAAYIDRILGDDVFRLELTAWLTMHDYVPLRHQLKVLHASLVDRGAVGLQAVLASYGLETLPPLTNHDVAAMFLPIVQGTVLSAEVQAADYEPEVVVRTVMAILLATTRPIGVDTPDLETAFRDHFER